MNNELFHRAACEALADDTSIPGLINDLGDVIESYLSEHSEEGISPQLRKEIMNSYTHAQRFLTDLHAWVELAGGKQREERWIRH